MHHAPQREVPPEMIWAVIRQALPCPGESKSAGRQKVCAMWSCRATGGSRLGRSTSRGRCRPPAGWLEASHLLRPTAGHRDLSGPQPRRLLVGHVHDCEATEVLLG